MLFNSFEFLFLFLPIGWFVYYWLCHRTIGSAPFVWLALISLFYYGWWNPKYLILLLASKGFNFLIGRILFQLPREKSRPLLAFAIIANIGLLVYYKYTAFIVENINEIGAFNIPVPNIVLPLAISFLTFQQIAYVVDIYQRKVAPHGILEYLLFVTFFPPLIAGPIVHHNEMMPQFSTRRSGIPWRRNAEIGLTLFIIGLFKKVGLADNLSLIVKPIFSAAQAGTPLSSIEAWSGALGYTFQIYFDFSGYSDMALGTACLFGIRLPINFYSPYQSANIIEFWRRWHMTLSRFLRDYVYISLGGNRQGHARRYFNLAITMVIGGIWHGAAWNFLFWGALHGFYLTVNHGWRTLVQRAPWGFLRHGGNRAWTQPLTLLAVVVAWVYFRADSTQSAHVILQKMFSLDVAGYSKGYLAAVQSSTPAQWLSLLVPQLSTALFVPLFLALCGAITLLLPNSIQLLPDFQPASHIYPEHNQTVDRRLRWSPTMGWAICMAAMFFMALLGLSGISEFIYYQF
jgi:D-alanyl-lipoteichoic acid acyltransferase DltB (MBOAT superfamily)